MSTQNETPADEVNEELNEAIANLDRNALPEAEAASDQFKSDDEIDNEGGDADMSDSGVGVTMENDKAIRNDDVPEVVEEFSSDEEMSRVREHYEAMTDMGAELKGEGEIPNAGEAG